MLRKSLFALIAAATLSLGMGASAPANAKVFISLGFGHPYYHHYHGYYHGCGWKKAYVKVWSHKKHKWVKVRTSRRVCW
jgi:hypothetical protein